jgi:hypothetical protein
MLFLRMHPVDALLIFTIDIFAGLCTLKATNRREKDSG